MIDLHIHTTFSSDGFYKPITLLTKAQTKGLKAISFTDHNEIEANFIGIKRAGKFSIKYIIGTEITSYWNGREFHILGYLFDLNSKYINKTIGQIKQIKREQAKKICKRLKQLGFEIYEEDVFRFSKGKPPTGVSYLRSILKNKKNLNDIRLAPYIKGEKKRSPYMHFYEDWLKPDRPGYVPEKEITTEEVIYAIIKSSGLPVIAHPQNISESELIEFIKMGIKGIEVYTTYHNIQQRAFYRNLAEKYSLVITAGSDFHGERIKKGVKLGEIGDNDISLLKKMEDYYKELYGKKPYSM